MKYRSILIIIAALLIAACAKPQPTQIIQPQFPEDSLPMENPVPGTVSGEWVEPMYDQVRVPGQLDPTGTYYRKGHEEIVEIRPGRYQEVQYGDKKPKPESNTEPNAEPGSEQLRPQRQY